MSVTFKQVTKPKPYVSKTDRYGNVVETVDDYGHAKVIGRYGEGWKSMHVEYEPIDPSGEGRR